MALDILVTRWQQSGDGQLLSTLRSLGSAFDATESKAARAQSWGMAIGAASAVAGRGLLNLTKASLQANGEVQRVETGFLTVLKSAEKTRELSKDVRDFDVKTPFSYLESAKAAQMLLASGFRDDLIPTMNAVGEAVVAAGGDTERFTRALAIMGKIKTSGVLTGVRVNQFAAAGINVKDILKKELGLTDEQMINIGRLKLKADIVIPALNKGLAEQFKGGIDRASKGYLGSLEVLAGSKDKLFAGIGKSINAPFASTIQNLIKLTDGVSNLVSQHPRITATLMALGGFGVVAGSIYGGVTAIKMAAMAKKALERATKDDDLAEKAKAVTAGIEGKAIEGVGNKATKTAGKLGLLARAKAFVGNPISLGGQHIPNATGGLVTGGSLLWGAGLGAGAGIGARDDMKQLGYSEGQSNLYAGITGAVTAGVATFVPPARLIILAAQLFRLGVDKFYNEKMEDRAENGPRDKDGNIINGDMGGTAAEQSRKQWARAHKLAATGNEEDGGEAWIAGITAKAQRKRGENEEKEASWQAQLAKSRAEDQANRAKAEKAARDEALWAPDPEVGQVTIGRSGARRVVMVLPPSPSDDRQRRDEYRGRTSTPNLAY